MLGYEKGIIWGNDNYRTNGAIVAEGWNRTEEHPLWHGEIDAINQCNLEDPKPDWYKLVMYSTAEPCPMCMGALAWAGVGGVVFGTSIEFLKRSTLLVGVDGRVAAVWGEVKVRGHALQVLDAASRDELQQAIADYRAGLVPLVVPITLVRHHVRHLDVRYLAGQVYLDPHPKELMLRNHV